MTVSPRYREPRLPVWLKIAWTAFIILLVPLYWHAYGPGNFLWFSDIALFALGVALWLEDARLASMTAVAVLALEIGWTVDFLAMGRFIGLAAYMYDATIPLWLRGLSLFHLAIPPATLWLLYKLGYDRRAFVWQSLFGWAVLAATYALTDPADNINWVFGPGEPQDVVHPLIYLAAIMAGLPLVVYLPSHLLLKRLFASPNEVRG